MFPLYLRKKFHSSFILIALIVLTSWSATAVSKVFPNAFPKAWINGVNCATEAKGQVHQYDENLFIIRQSVCTNFEAPFIYLLFGKNKVLMQDSGASDFGQRQIVDNVIKQWLIDNELNTIELIVSHSHGHGDHVAGDSLFIDRPNTQIIGKDLDSVKRFFGFNHWPDGMYQLDLGGRRIDILPLPGHQDAHLALYDYETQILFTGDSLYPGRIYFKQENFEAFSQSMKKLYKYAQTKTVKHILGTHIEMTQQPGVDYPFTAKAHKNERKLELTIQHLEQLVNWLPNAKLPVKKQVFDDFILYPTN
jgi:glyoxylase-like metal-dependent hydrolase (beta-lactamase superfamily II)|tara:strand:- start:636 stop:1553 length:918 start_codon:yes stop_codon:yes gene_type:complete